MKLCYLLNSCLTKHDTLRVRGPNFVLPLSIYKAIISTSQLSTPALPRYIKSTGIPTRVVGTCFCVLLERVVGTCF